MKNRGTIIGVTNQTIGLETELRTNRGGILPICTDKRIPLKAVLPSQIPYSVLLQ